MRAAMVVASFMMFSYFCTYNDGALSASSMRPYYAGDGVSVAMIRIKYIYTYREFSLMLVL